MKKLIITSFLATITIVSNAQLLKKLKEQYKNEVKSGVNKQSENKVTEKSGNTSTAIVNAPEKAVNNVLDKLKKKNQKIKQAKDSTKPLTLQPPIVTIDSLNN